MLIIVLAFYSCLSLRLGNFANWSIKWLFYTIVLVTILLIINNIFLTNINYRNLKDNSIGNIKSYKKVIIPSLKKLIKYESYIYKIEDLILCKTPIDVLKCYVANPKQFYSDLCDIILFKIWKSIKGFVSKDYKYLNFEVSERNLEIFHKVFDNLNEEAEIKKWFNMIKDTYTEILIYQKVKFEGEVYDYKYFINKIMKMQERYNEIKAEYLENERTDIELDYDFFLDSEMSENHYFAHTIYNKLFLYINNISQDYSRTEDYILFNSYYYFLSNKYCNLSLNAQNEYETTNLDTKFLWSFIESKITFRKLKNNSLSKIRSMIEDKLEISSMKTDESLFISNKKVEYEKYVPEDKTYNGIINKIERKLREKDNIDGNYFYCLVKDPKRLSLVFKTRDDLMSYMNKLREIFSKDNNYQIYNKRCDLYIRIKEIKNNLSNNSPIGDSSESGNKKENEYKDLKIIFEYYYKSKNITLQLECQCNLESLIRWKKADHIFYNYNRSIINYENMQSNIKHFFFMESKTRIFLRALQLLFYAFSLISILTLLTISIQHYHEIKGRLECTNNNQYCLDYCLAYDYPYDECIQYINREFITDESDINYHQYISNETISVKMFMLKLFCEKFKNNQNTHSVCYDKLLNNNFNLISISNESTMCYYYYNNYFDCFKDEDNKYIVDKYTQMKPKNKFYIIEDKYINTDLNNKIDYNNNPYYDILLPYKDYEILDLQYDKRICILYKNGTKNNLDCLEYELNYDRDVIRSEFRYMCFLNSGKLECNGQISIKQHLVYNNHSISSNDNILCVVKYSGKLFCIFVDPEKSNSLSLSIIKEGLKKLNNIRTQIKSVSVGRECICYINFDHQLHCSCFAPELNHPVQSINNTLTNNIEMVKVDYRNLCYIKLDQSLHCYGSNTYGLSEVPMGHDTDMEYMELKDNVACAISIKSILLCWGKLEYHKFTQIHTKIYDVKIGYFFIAILDNAGGIDIFCKANTHCNVPQKYKSDIIRISASNYLCTIQNVKLNTKIFCWDFSKNEIYADNMYNEIDFSYRHQNIIKIPPESFTGIENFKYKNKKLCFRRNLQNTYCYDENYSTEIVYNSNMYCLTQNSKVCYIKYSENSKLFNIICDHNKLYEVSPIKYGVPKEMSCGFDNACIIFADYNNKNFIYCFGGDNSFGQNNIYKMMKSNVIKIKAGLKSTCVLKVGYGVLCNGIHSDREVDIVY